MTVWMRFRYVWLGFLMFMLAWNVVAFAGEAYGIPTHPVGGVLFATLSWLAVLALAWAIDIQCQLIRRWRRPRVRVLRDGVPLPVSLRSMGTDPDGQWSWVMDTPPELHFGDEVLVESMSPESALYILDEDGFVMRVALRIAPDCGEEHA